MDQHISELIEHLEGHDGDWKRKDLVVDVADFEDTGRGMRAKRDISIGEVIISIPADLAITSKVIRTDPVMDDLIENYIKKPDQISYKELFMIYLLYQKSLGKSSKFYKFLKTVPKSYTNPSLWKPEEVQLLPKTLKEKTLAEQTDINSSYEKVLTLISRCPAFHDIQISKSEYYWAYFSLTTRAFYWGDHYTRTENAFIMHKHLVMSPYRSYAMLPLIDMFNHHCNSGKSNAKLEESTGRFEIVTEAGFKKGDQVFIQYGSSHSSSDLLQFYGFFNIGVKNNNDVVNIELSEILEVITPVSTDAIEYLEDNCLHKGFCIGWDGPSWSLQKAIAVMLAEDKDIESDFVEYYIHDIKTPVNLVDIEKGIRSVVRGKMEKLELTFEKRLEEFRKIKTINETGEDDFSFDDEVMIDLSFSEFIVEQHDKSYIGMVKACLEREFLYEKAE